MITIETLKKFCGGWPEWLRTPWSQNGWTYATEGHVILQVPAIPGVEEKDIKQIKGLPWEELGKPVKWRLRPETITALRERFSCRHCATHAERGPECPECKGEGCPYCDESVCKKRGAFYHPDQCPECGGTRWSMDGVVWRLAEGYFVAPWMLQRLVDALGVIEFMEPRKGTEMLQWPPVAFRFEGGHGLLMPMNPHSGAVVVNK